MNVSVFQGVIQDLKENARTKDGGGHVPGDQESIYQAKVKLVEFTSGQCYPICATYWLPVVWARSYLCSYR